MFEKIPHELKLLRKWVCWKGIPDESRPGKLRKIPIDAKTGQPAGSTSPDTWCDFDTAVREAVKYSGIGFIFDGTGYFGVDLDGVDEDLEKFRRGDMDGIVSEFVYTLRSYTELSQSGKGIHIICKGKIPEGGKRKKNVEMYENGRYFIMTGNAISDFSDIADCTDTIAQLHGKYIGGAEPKPVQQTLPENFAPIPDVDEIIQTALNSKQGNLFESFLAGDFQAYSPDRSSADMAFCNILAFWTACDPVKMDAIYRRSGMMRKKWDEIHDGKRTYGQMTIQKAIDGCTSVYTPPKKSAYAVNFAPMPEQAGAEQVSPQKFYTFDDTGNAERLCDVFGDDIRYCFTDNTWLYYDGRKWCDDTTGTILRCVDILLERMQAEQERYADDENIAKAYQKHLTKSRSHNAKKAMIMETRQRCPVTPDQLDKNKFLLNCTNGTVNLRTGELQEHDRNDLITKSVTTRLGDICDCPVWLAFLNDIFGGDPDMISYVQQAIGYSLSGSIAEQCIFFLYGEGRNGKSTFLDVIYDILGDYSMNVQPETLTVKRQAGNQASSDIARLKGARFVVSVEPNEGARLNEGLIKQLSGGDPLTARKQYASEFEFRPEFKIWLATNHKPIIRGRDDGIWRRIHLIPFTVQIPEEKVDRTLKYRLKKEYPAILKWAVDGFTAYQRAGELKKPAQVIQAISEYKGEMDVLTAFIADCCTVGNPNDRTQSTVLYTAYTQWARANNEYEMSSTKFSQEMAKKFTKTRTSKNKAFIGIRVDEYQVNITG